MLSEENKLKLKMKIFRFELHITDGAF